VKRIVSISLAAVTMAALAACGEARHDPVVARVGRSTITRTAVVRRMSALAPDHAAPVPPDYAACIERQQSLALAQNTAKATFKTECEQQYQTLKRQALESLISSYWLIEEASARGLRVSAREVERRLQNRGRAPAVADATNADAELKARVEVAAMELERSLRESEPAITRRQALTYYRRHRRLFERQELRYVDLAENFASSALAARARRDVEAGASLAGISLHEVIERYNLTGREKERRAAEDAIFAARPHVLNGPIRLNRSYAIFEVTRIVSPMRRSFARVERSIDRRLAREQRRRDLARLVGSWRAKWLAKTDCAPGYVVQKCRQYAGARAPEDPAAFN
jgi:foldase protein PrsA